MMPPHNGRIPLLLALLSAVPSSPETPPPPPPSPTVAIIGGGIGGTAAAYFLEQEFRGSGGVRVDLYEKDAVGGRLRTVRLANAEFETGGSIIHSRNRYMVGFLKELGLSKRAAMDGGRVGIFDGSRFTFVEPHRSWMTLFYLMLQYGFDILRLWSYANEMLSDFERVYDLQDEGRSFTTVQELVEAMSPALWNTTQRPIRDVLRERGISDATIDELGGPTFRANYGQTDSMHGFVGLVSLVAAAGDSLWSVLGGNQLVPQRLLLRSGASLLKDQVTSVSWNEAAKKFSLVTRKGKQSLYDVVIVAAPMTKDLRALAFEGALGKQVEPLLPKGSFQRTVTHMIAGIRSSIYPPGEDSSWRANGNSAEPSGVEEILVCNNLTAPLAWNAVGRQSPVDGHPSPEVDVYKVFSEEPLSQTELDRLFVKVSAQYTEDWLAYPRYDSRIRTGGTDFILDSRGLFYINAVEEAASAMEMSCLGARNAALLTAKLLGGKRAKSSPPGMLPYNDEL